MRALTIKQPWASLEAHGIKDIENRTWRTHYRGKVLIHAATPTKFDIKLTDEQTRLAMPVLKTAFDGTMPFGAIIGEIEIIDCVTHHPSIWAQVQIGDGRPIYNWVLANPVLYDKPILNIKGKLSFWQPDICLQMCESCNQQRYIDTMMADDDANWFCKECWSELEQVMKQEALENKLQEDD